MLFKKLKKNYAYPELKWPSYARELTEEEKLLVNGGGQQAMTSQHQAEITEAIKDPAFSNCYDVTTDAAYFIPGVGIYVGGGMTVGKEVVELGI